MIYYVEDDENIRELVVYTLQNAGHPAQGFASGGEFFRALEAKMPDLVLLDIMLPDEDGISILKKLRESEQTDTLPIIMVTAKGGEFDKVIGLDSGADDYIAKPFGMMELLSRIKALLRRATPQPSAPLLHCGDISMDTERHLVTIGGEEVILTLKEYELLRYLMEHEGTVITRDRLLDAIWGYDFGGETRTVDVHIRTLRQKLGEQGQLIETVRGVGYRLGACK